MPLNLVIGRGGLLGSSIARAISKEHRSEFLARKIRWGTENALEDLNESLESFFTQTGNSEWQIFWCAGSGVTDTNREQLKQEADLLSAFLQLLAQQDSNIQSQGVFIFCSSAGALYGGAENPPFTEDSLPIPLGEYGKFKLVAEDHVNKFAEDTKVKTAIARIANLYGPGQSLEKQQGILTRLASASLTNTPVSIYVPLDTLRDYIFVDDCATKLLLFAGMVRKHEHQQLPFLKIIASGTSSSLGEVLGIFKRVHGKNPLVIMKESAVSSLQSKDLRLKSLYWQELDEIPVKGLLEGVSLTRQDLELKLLLPGHFAS